jgi:hypothetical protein
LSNIRMILNSEFTITCIVAPIGRTNTFKVALRAVGWKIS